jgi:DNA-binding GntR family transcriptional regulator
MTSPSAVKPMSSARAPTLVEQVFTQLRREILQGMHKPGEKLKLDQLQAHYGLSSSPLREALNRLAQEGLVHADDRRGFRAAPMSIDDINDISRMRILLDVPALAQSTREGCDSWEADVLAAYHRLERLESRMGDGPVALDEEWSRRHRDFHAALLAACPSARQLAWSASLFDQAERYRFLSARFRPASRRKNDEHRRLMKAALERDAGTACALLEEHIQATRRNVILALQQMQATRP